MKKFFLLLVATISMGAIGGFATTAEAQEDATVIEMFHGDGCPHCANQWAFMPVLEIMYPNLEVIEHEVWHDADNRALFAERMEELGSEPSGVPTTVIKDEIVNGFNKDQLISVMGEQFGPPSMGVRQAEALYAETNPDAGSEEGDAANRVQTPLSDADKERSQKQNIFLGVGGLLLLGGIIFLFKKE